MNLNDKYRPSSFNDVVGHQSVIRSLRSSIENNIGSTFILHGPSGVGKTTIARIFASEVGCTELIEKDAASNSGKDHIKDVIRSQDYHTFNGGARVFIIDECHGLSRAAWDVLLTTIEEVPKLNYWFFCTTEINKIPKTIKTRCNEIQLHPIGHSDILSLLEDVSDKEKIDCSRNNMRLIAESCGGSPRKALKLLESSIGLSDTQFKSLMFQEDETGNGYKIARAISKSSFDMNEVMNLCGLIKNENPEVTRQTIRAYFTTICLRDHNNAWAKSVLLAFEKPSVEQNKITDIVMRIFKLDKWRSE